MAEVGPSLRMPGFFASEPITPIEGSFDLAGMARGEPGLPLKFHWRKKEWVVAAKLESGKEYGDCTHGSGERYVRRHIYRIRTTNGWVLQLYFQRTMGRSKSPSKSRWWVRRIEEEGLSHPSS